MTPTTEARNLEHLSIGAPFKISIPELAVPKTLYEILKDFINDNKDELILQIQEVKSLNAITCFITKDFDCSDKCDQRGFNFLLRHDDSIELVLQDEDDEDDEGDEDEDEGEDGRITPPDCVFDDGMNPENLGVEIAGMKM